MKIVEVELIQLVKRLDEPMRNAKQGSRQRVANLVRLTTDDGLTGLGEAWCDAALAEGVVLGKLRPQVLGKDPFDTERIWHQAFEGGAMWDPRGAFVAGLSGIDLACWDLKGKALGMPVYRLLGGLSREWIPAYASDLHWQEDADAMARKAAQFVEQ